MTYFEKHVALCEYLSKRGHIDSLTALAVQLRLCEQGRWIEYDVKWLWTRNDKVYYSTPSFNGCGLWSCDGQDVRNSAHLYDQLLGCLSKRDRNLF